MSLVYTEGGLAPASICNGGFNFEVQLLSFVLCLGLIPQSGYGSQPRVASTLGWLANGFQPGTSLSAYSVCRGSWFVSWTPQQFFYQRLLIGLKLAVALMTKDAALFCSIFPGF